MPSPTLWLALDLIGRPSVTPADAGCQPLIQERLERQGFRCEPMIFGEVTNLWARRGTQGPVFVFAGHTDVVPPGPLNRWTSPPFAPQIRDGLLYGRGAADMKGSLAAMVTACEDFLRDHPKHRGSIGFLLTSDEEGPSIDGTAKVVEALMARGEGIDYCLVGEPSSQHRLADTIKNGRRGSLSGRLRLLGKQGHVAYPHLARNPLHALAPVLARLCAEVWDQGNSYFPPTSFQISNLQMGTGAENVIPGELEAWFNFRFSSETDANTLIRRVTELLESIGLHYQIEWKLSGNPFLTPVGELVQASCWATEQVLGYRPELSTSGGTSDGRFIALMGAQVAELGPLNATIHQIDECVAIEDLERLSLIYRKILERLLA